MYQDFKEHLSLFNKRKVNNLIVDGYAVSFHAQPRATKDLDILIRRILTTQRLFSLLWQGSERRLKD